MIFDQLSRDPILLGYGTASQCSRFAAFLDKLLASDSRFQVLTAWLWSHFVVWESQERVTRWCAVMPQKNRVLNYSFMNTAELAVSRSTARTDISVRVYDSRLISVLSSFPNIHALFGKHFSFSVDIHWSRNNETCVFLFCFRMVTNTFGNRNYKPLVSVLIL